MTGSMGERVTAVLAERDAIQANLLELDGSFARRLLDGAALTGQTRLRWTAAAAALAGLWQTYLAYSAVVDRVAELGPADRRSSRRDLPELAGLLNGPCVQRPAAPAPLARRDLVSTGSAPVTLAAAVAAMRRSFAAVTEVTSAVEEVLAAVGPPLDAAAEELDRSRPAVAGLGDEPEAAFRDAQAALGAQRAAANSDPLALFSPGGPDGGRVDTSGADGLRERVAALSLRIAELDRLRAGARDRIGALATATASARADRADALGAWRHAAARVSPLPPPPPDIAEPPSASLAALAAGGQWTRLRAELDRCEAELAGSAAQTSDLRRAAAAAVGRRDELRGLLGAYKAKAVRLGAAEDAELAARYDQAYDQLWTAPCDLAAAESALSGYQRAILATEGRR
jgi:hypothetical protein